MTPPNVAFGNLYRACLRNGIALRIRTWDGGQAIYADWQGTGENILHLHSDWGAGDVVDAATIWLLGKGLISEADLKG